MRYSKNEQKSPENLRRKMLAALSMLLVATVLMTTTSYAWLVMSTAPEVSGISTNIGANGSLEIALLNTQTRKDMTTIRSGVGESLASNNPSANNAWGNLVDLSLGDYGLGNILLMPARLNAISTGDSYAVDSGMLAVPTYGYDGRIVELTDNTMSAVYQDQEFAFTLGTQDYGVRAIGTSDSISVQGSALALAKSNIATYTNSARNNTTSVLNSSGDDLFGIVLAYSVDGSATMYSDTELDALKGMLKNLQSTLDYVDLALRQGIVAFAASEIGNEATFNEVKDMVMDTSSELGELAGRLDEVGSVPPEYISWIKELDETQNDLNAAKNACDALTGGEYTWTQFRSILDYIMNLQSVYIGDTLFENLDMDTLMGMIGADVKLTLAPGSGIFANFADFIGNYSAVMSVMGTNIEITTASNAKPDAYLNTLGALVKELEAADGTGEAAAAVKLTVTYGYALDLAFRCNAAGADLLLQTNPEQRVYEESASGSTQGGGSFMEFTSMDSTLTMEQRLKLMDAIRVCFLDDQGAILAIGKLNTSNRSFADDAIKAPLYLYDYSFVEDKGGSFLEMGERRLVNNTITDLPQNVAKAVTVVVWLDGDLVDNSMVSATEAASLSGVLNLQFATSADLVPAANSALLNYTTDMSGLEALIAENKAIADAGQGVYTTVSWNSFSTAYSNAVAISESLNASQIQVRNAMLALAKAAAALEVVSREPVQLKVQQLREQMGETEDLARYVIVDENGLYHSIEEYTQEEYDNLVRGEVNQVDYDRNLTDEGNGIYTTIYTNESWSNMAAALYEAEAVIMNSQATDEQLNAVLSAVEISEKAMEREVYFKPYQYKGAIYYEAICDADKADTYGKWYDSDFQRVVSDLTILNLDAYAEPAVICGIDDKDELDKPMYVAYDSQLISPYISIFDTVYPELSGETVMGVKWDEMNADLFAEVMDQRHVAELNELIGIVQNENLTGVDTSAAQNLINKANNGEIVSLEDASAAIVQLESAVTAALDQLAKEEEGDDLYISASQRTLLVKAVSSARAVEGYENAENTDEKIVVLRQATEAAEALLALESVATKEDAAKALDTLNAALDAVGAKQVTQYNTVIHRIPNSSGVRDIVYDVEYPSVTLNLSGKTGSATFGAQMLTSNGIVVNIKKNVVVYIPADAAIIHDGSDAESVQNLEKLSLRKNQSFSLFADLLHPKAEGLEIDGSWYGETVKSCTWASSNTSIASITGKDSSVCNVTALEAGTAVISLSVETVQGNTYTCHLVLTVTEN